MSISFTSKLKNVINQIEKYPKDSIDIDLVLPYKFQKKLNRQFIERSKKIKNGEKIIKQEIESNRISETVNKTLNKLISVGIEYETSPVIVEQSILYSFEYLIQNYPVHLIWSPVNIGINYPSDEVEAIDKQVSLTNFDYISPWKELHYGIENSLFFWTGTNWSITPLGKFFKTLSIPTGNVFLLMLENYLNVPERNSPFNINPWHISNEFLRRFLEEKDIYVDIGEGEYKLMELDPNMEFLNRLDEFQLTTTSDLTLERRGEQIDEFDSIPIIHIGDDFYCTNLTEYGKEIILRVLDESPSILKSMIENLVTFELSGSEYIEVSDSRIFIRILSLANQYSEITGDQLEPIQEICQSLKEGKTDIMTIRGLPPTIEKLLKNILIEFNIIERGNSKITLGGIIQKFETLISNGQPIINYDTIQYIKNIDRNSLMHGSISPNGEIKDALINLMMNILIKIYEEYEIKRNET